MLELIGKIAKHFFTYGRGHQELQLLCILVACGAMTATSQRQSISCLFLQFEVKSVLLNVLYATPYSYWPSLHSVYSLLHDVYMVIAPELF